MTVFSQQTHVFVVPHTPLCSSGWNWNPNSESCHTEAPVLCWNYDPQVKTDYVWLDRWWHVWPTICCILAAVSLGKGFHGNKPWASLICCFAALTHLEAGFLSGPYSSALFPQRAPVSLPALMSMLTSFCWSHALSSRPLLCNGMAQIDQLCSLRGRCNSVAGMQNPGFLARVLRLKYCWMWL